MRVQPFVTLLQIEKSRLTHLATPRLTRSSRANPESDFSRSGKPHFSRYPIVSLLKLPSDTKIVVERPLPNEDQIKSDPSAREYIERVALAHRHNIAVSPSAPTCYRELYVSSISLQKNLGSLKFSAAFLYRTFGSDHGETHLYDGQRTIPKPEHFPATSVDQMDQAGADARAAFTEVFKDWIAHRVKV